MSFTLVSQHIEKWGGCFAFHRGAKNNYDVRLRAVITYYDPEEPDLFVQDSTTGNWVNLEIVKPNVPLNTEDLVEVERVTEAPDFTLQVAVPDSAY